MLGLTRSSQRMVREVEPYFALDNHGRMLWPGASLDLEAGVEYDVLVSATEGCDFAEGHRRLSKDTRDRLILRHNIRWDAEAESHPAEVREDVEEGDVTDLVWARHPNGLP